MDPFLVILVGVSALASLLGGWMVTLRFWSVNSLHYWIAFGAGFLMTISLLELIPEAIEGHPHGPLYILLGIFVILLLHFFFPPHAHDHAPDIHSHHAGKTAHMRTAVTIGMILHTFFDGLTLVAAYYVHPHIGMLVFVAILLHKIPDGIILSALTLKSTGSKARALQASALISLATVVGALLMGLMIHWEIMWEPETVAAVALAISAGVFLSVALSDLIPDLQEHAASRWEFGFILLGALVFLLAEWLLELSGLVAHLH